jgi:hypothetical protein
MIAVETPLVLLVFFVGGVLVAGVVMWAMTVAGNREEHAENERARLALAEWGEARGWTLATELRTFSGRWALGPERPDAPVARADGRHRDHDVAVVLERPQDGDGRATVSHTTCLVETGTDLPRLRVTARRPGRDRGARITGDAAFDEVLTVRCDGPPGEVLSEAVRASLLRQVAWLPAEPWTLLRTPGQVVLLTHDGFPEAPDLDALVDDAIDIALELAKAHPPTHHADTPG